MYLGELHARLIELAQRRVRAGEITERGLSKLCGMSQPHMHNVLKNIRSLSNESADRLMQALHVTIADLVWSLSGDSELEVRTVLVLRNRLGPGADAAMTVYRGTTPLPAHLVAGLVNPVVARLAPDLALPRVLAANDLVLLDQNPAVRSSVRGAGPWVVAEGGGFRARYLRTGGTLLYIADEATLADPRKWQPVSLAERNILEIVMARIVWIGREIGEEPADGED